MKYFFMVLLLLCSSTFGQDEMKVGRHNVVELCDTGDQVVVHYTGVDRDVLQFSKDGKEYLCVTPYSSGNLRMLITIVNFETKKLDSKDLTYLCVDGRTLRPTPDPWIKPIPDVPAEDPVEKPKLDLSDLLDLISSKHRDIVRKIVRQSLEGFSSDQPLETAREQFNKVFRRNVANRKSLYFDFDEYDLVPFISGLHDRLNSLISKGEIKTSKQYLDAISSLG